MQKRRRLFVIPIAVGVFLGVIVLVFRPAPEPEYGGKKLSEWVMACWAPPYTNYSAETAEAKNAIRHIGTNGLPYLLKWVGYEMPAWKAKLYEIANSVLNGLNRSVQCSDDKNVCLARGAINALIALGRNADGVIDSLTQLRDTPRGRATAARAAIALGGLSQVFTPDKAFVSTIASEVRAMYLDSPQSHPSFTFKVLGAEVGTNTYLLSVPHVKLDLDPPSQRYATMAFSFATNRPYLGPRLTKTGPTNALTNPGTNRWIRKSWY